MFSGASLSLVYMPTSNDATYLHPEFPRWRTDTGSNYNFATENDIKVLSAATAMF